MKKFLNGNRILSKYFFILCLLLPQLALAHNFTTEQKEGIRLFKEGVKLADEKKYMDSLVFFDNAMTKFPKLTSAYYAKSKVLATLGKNKEAIKVCDDALNLKKEQPQILSQKAFLLYGLKNFKESLDIAQLAVKYGPDSSVSYRARANAYAALGKLELAVSDYDKSLSLTKYPNHPFYAETYLNRFCPLYSLKRYEEALATCDKALEITDNAKNLPQIYSKRAAALNKLGKYEEALEYSDKALEVNSRDSLAIKEKKIARSKLKKSTWF